MRIGDHMKILGISGSPTKEGNNEKIISVVLEIAGTKGFETESILLSEKKVKPCIACGTCARGEKCPINDDMQEIYTKLAEADAIVFSSPVYFGGMTAQLKALFDRSVLLRRQGFQLKGKFGAAMAVGGSRNGGQEKTIQGIHDSMLVHGMMPVGDGAHFGGIAQKPVDDDEIGMKTVIDTIENLCETLERIEA